MKNWNDYIAEFNTESHVSIFRKGIVVNFNNGPERSYLQMIDLLKESASDILYANCEDIVGEIKFLAETFDFGHEHGLSVSLERKRVFPPTIGRYIGYLVLQYNELKRKIKSLEVDIGYRMQESRRMNERLVKLHGQCDDKTKELIEEQFPYLFGSAIED